MPSWTPVQLSRFADAAQSLRLYRRAELVSEKNSTSLIERLYVDPLPHDGVLSTMLRPNTTFLIGRKGTGKSTVFQRTQHDIRKHKTSISAYVDVKTIFESSDIDQVLLQKIAEQPNASSVDEIQKLLLYKAFISAVFTEIRTEIKKQLESSWMRLKDNVGGGKRRDVLEAIDDILDGTSEANFLDVTGYQAIASKETERAKVAASGKASADIRIEAAMTAGTGKASTGSSVEVAGQLEDETGAEQSYSRTLIRVFDLKSVMTRLADVLSSIGIKRLFIFVDDFSELPSDAMHVFVDTILAPLNNWSNELIKFKIAAYPNRIYYGRIDRTKIDEIYLDMFKLYGGQDAISMEKKSIEFTKRLFITRIREYCHADPIIFIDGRSDEQIYRLMFNATMGNPRNLGHLLHYLYESNLVHGNEITIKSIGDAAAKYFEEKVEPFFGIQQFRHESFEERSSVFSLKELLESIVSQARSLRTYAKSDVTRRLGGRIPTSHFHVISAMEFVLSTLEMNFFVTKYYEMKDRDGRTVSIYALNFGLCSKNSISFGRPEGDREHRLYYVERIFDYTSIIRRHLQANQEIKCQECGAVHGLELLETIKTYGMLCPACRKGTCTVVNLSRKYEHLLKEISDELLLPPTELGILETLYSEGRNLAAADIAAELDCSYQLVGKRGKIMAGRGLVERPTAPGGRKLFALSDVARTHYFSENPSRKLNIRDPEDTAD